jgi:hypothetical protein
LSWSFPPAQTYQKALFAAGIPATGFITNDIHSEYNRFKSLGVTFRGEPKNIGPIIAVLFEDTSHKTFPRNLNGRAINQRRANK